jgi:4-hydroxy-3-polyprenylbenzoate decarboxylase
MGYHSLRHCIEDLRRTNQIVEITREVDPHLEAAEIQRRVYQAGGPAVLFSRVKGTQFPMVSNLFGTLARARYLFADALTSVQRLIALKADPDDLRRHPFRYAGALWAATYARPKRVRWGSSRCHIGAHQTTVSALPQLVSWPRDGGAFITLPLVYTEDPTHPGWSNSNLGMYRVQLSGGQYEPDREVGMHYQIHRGIGVHHARALQEGKPLRVHVYVGGPPSMTLAAVMPLPEGLPELAFAGVLGRRRVRLASGASSEPDALPMWADADFCIAGTIDPDKQLPEGPFGDHLGYYSLQHPFPVMRVERVFHRHDAIWPFTSVGRPPQEDTAFGKLIHELTAPMIPAVLPGVHAVHAVDEAGVHPLLLAIGSERYRPYDPDDRPQELLTQANAILGQGQMSLAKFLLIVNHQDNTSLSIHDVEAYFVHLLERIDFRRDVHFHTQTTIDTLDYSGQGFQVGSKVVLAASGAKKHTLPRELPVLSLPDGFHSPRLALPGVLVVQSPPFETPVLKRDPEARPLEHEHGYEPEHERHAMRFGGFFRANDPINQCRLIVLVDDSEFAARSLANFLWVTFTRANPACDVYGIEASIRHKHWGCRGSLIVDARQKPHHAPALIEDREVSRRVDALGAPGGPLHGII